MEIWKDIIGYESLYSVSNLGRVKALKRKINSPRGFRTARERILKIADCNGYSLVMLCKEGTRINKLVHRLVAISFLNNPENKPCINHKNGIKTDNRVENLEWSTYSENELHSRRVLKKQSIFGVNHGKYKHGKYSIYSVSGL